MEITKEEQDYLIEKIKEYLEYGYSKKEVKNTLLMKGFNVSKIERCWSIAKKVE